MAEEFTRLGKSRPDGFSGMLTVTGFCIFELKPGFLRCFPQTGHQLMGEAFLRRE
jgi:hypothetical protein